MRKQSVCRSEYGEFRRRCVPAHPCEHRQSKNRCGSTSRRLHERTTHPRNLIIAGAGSQVQIVESYTGTGKYFTNAVTEIIVGENAIVEHIKLEEESPGVISRRDDSGAPGEEFEFQIA